MLQRSSTAAAAAAARSEAQVVGVQQHNHAAAQQDSNTTSRQHRELTFCFFRIQKSHFLVFVQYLLPYTSTENFKA
jgi:hypothetical protein